ncbi:MAG: hypothetical protein R3321_05715, partial [Nitrososphaeraceae archaeon]|nr:hypothetical protein [Nitrososphaeraceae archaeon]
MNTLEKLERKGMDIHNKYVLKIVYTGGMNMRERLQFFKEYFIPCILGQDSEMTITDDRVVITD